jgi:hypothetical protein
MTVYAQNLDQAEALALLSAAVIGRVIYTNAAMPAVRPLPFRVAAGGGVLLRTASDSALVQAIGGTLVAFEVDEIRETDGAGWCVMLLGRAVVGAKDPATGDVEIHIFPEAVHGSRFRPVGHTGPGVVTPPGGGAEEAASPQAGPERLEDLPLGLPGLLVAAVQAPAGEDSGGDDHELRTGRHQHAHQQGGACGVHR